VRGDSARFEGLRRDDSHRLVREVRAGAERRERASQQRMGWLLVGLTGGEVGESVAREERVQGVKWKRENVGWGISCDAFV
jgi:hypothetical protein